MALMLMYPNQANADLIPCSTSTENALAFGFPATRVMVRNDRAAAVYVSFSSSPSTAGFRTCSGEVLDLALPQCSAVAVASTTTSTGTLVRVLALG